MNRAIRAIFAGWRKQLVVCFNIAFLRALTTPTKKEVERFNSIHSL